MANNSRHIGLDLLRVVAVLLVLMRHLTVSSEVLESHPILAVLKRGGWVGVDLFFVLSGFLVSSLLFVELKETGGVSLKRFLVRRGLKIYPSFWIFLACSILIPFETRESITAKSLAGELLFLQNYVGRLWPHTWSLAVEEHFYFGLAVLFGILASKRKIFDCQQMPWIFLAVGVGCLAMRIYFSRDGGHSLLFYKTHFRIDSLFFGVLISYYWNYRGFAQKIENLSTKVRVLCFSVGILCLTPAFCWSYSDHPLQFCFGHTVYYIGSGAILVSVLNYRRTDSAGIRGVGMMGAASYPVYLWHMAVNEGVVWLVYEILETPRSALGLYVVLLVVSSFAFGYFMQLLVDNKVAYFRERWYPGGSQRFRV